MTNEALREIFNQAAAKATDADQIARVEICREYFTNPEFRKALENRVWEMTR